MSTQLYRKPTEDRVTMSAVSIIAASLLMSGIPAFAQTPQVKFSAAVPAPPAQMQVYKLAQTAAPVQFLNEKLAARKLPALQVETDKMISRTAQTPDAVRAYVDNSNGDAHLIPNLAELTTAIKPVSATGLTAARAALTDVRFIPKDATELRFADPITVTGASNVQAPAAGAKVALAAKAVAPSTIFTIHPAVRYAGGYRVYGLGSHASVSTSNDGAVIGALRRWRTASLGDMIKPTLNADQVRAEIQRQLGPQLSAKGTTAEVISIDVAYVDSNKNFLQPGYRFVAHLTPANKQIAGIAVAGFVPIGKLYEPLPDLTTPVTNGPSNPSANATLVRPETDVKEVLQPALTASVLTSSALASVAATNQTGSVGTPITLGEYANQDWPNNNAYVTMSNSFYNGLEDGNNQVSSNHPKIVRSQWYVAHPFEVVGAQSKNYMNAVNIAYTVPHGDWLLNTTLSNYGDLWYVTQIGTGGNPGFGAAAGGKLATWVIMSCEVVPSMYDRQNEVNGTGNPQTAFNAWWPVFKGLHNVIGFRTEMLYPDDNLNYAFGKDAALGGDINAAWFQEVAANDPNDGTYNDGHLKGNPVVHYDRASTIIDARDLGKSIYDVTPQTASTTLWNFWMNN
jgi:hypothetical protein